MIYNKVCNLLKKLLKKHDLINEALYIVYPANGRRAQRKYDEEQIRELLRLVLTERMPITRACNQCRININTGRGYIRRVKVFMAHRRTFFKIHYETVVSRQGTSKSLAFTVVN